MKFQGIIKKLKFEVFLSFEESFFNIFIIKHGTTIDREHYRNR